MTYSMLDLLSLDEKPFLSPKKQQTSSFGWKSICRKLPVPGHLGRRSFWAEVCAEVRPVGRFQLQRLQGGVEQRRFATNRNAEDWKFRRSKMVVPPVFFSGLQLFGVFFWQILQPLGPPKALGSSRSWLKLWPGYCDKRVIFQGYLRQMENQNRHDGV